MVRTKPGAPMPAFANTVSMPPNASTVPATAASSASLVGDVGVEDDRAGAVGGDAPQLVRAEPDERDARAAGGEPARDLGADPVRGAGDEDGLAGERGHDRETSRGSSRSRTTRSTASRRTGRARRRPLRVAGRRVVERGPQALRDAAHEPRVELRGRAAAPRTGPGDGVVTSGQPSASASSCAIP